MKLFKAVTSLIDLIPESDKPMEFEAWCATFPPRRRDELLNTVLNMDDEPVNNCRVSIGAKSFIKREIAPKFEDDICFKDPRFIQGCPIQLSACVGPTLRRWTKRVKESIGPNRFTAAEVAQGKHIVYTCGRSNEQIGECFKRSIGAIEESALLAGYSNPKDYEILFLEDDQSRFDLHLTEGPFKFLNTLYHKKLSKRVQRLLHRYGESRGTSSLGTRYKIPFTMQSGWPDTSVGDTLINAAMKTYIHGVGRPWISIICGDDSVTVTTRGEINRLGGLDGILAQYTSLGMEVEASLTNDPLDVGFCSGRFYPCGDTYVLFPKPGRLLSKIACDMHLRTADNQLAWLLGIVSTLEFYGKVDPLMGALAVGLGAGLNRSGKVINEFHLEHKQRLDGTASTVPHDVYMYYDHHYGISSGQVDELVALLKRQKVGTICDDPVLQHIARVDNA
jgi:hypothetical protein